MTPDHAGNVVGIDPHKRTLTATVADARGGILASAHFRVSGGGHRELEAWARQFGQIARWGIEGSASWGRHTAVFLTDRGHDMRDMCANRTPRSDRARQRGKSDTLDSERIAREVLAHPLLPKAFKRAGQEQGPDEQHQLLALWHNRRECRRNRVSVIERTSWKAPDKRHGEGNYYKESYVEDLASHDGPDHALATREGAAKRWIRGACRPAIEPRKVHCLGCRRAHDRRKAISLAAFWRAVSEPRGVGEPGMRAISSC